VRVGLSFIGIERRRYQVVSRIHRVPKGIEERWVVHIVGIGKRVEVLSRIVGEATVNWIVTLLMVTLVVTVAAWMLIRMRPIGVHGV
jgi:hypothetical protein